MITNDLISIITPCYNEEANIRPFYDAVKSVFDLMGGVYGLKFYL